MAEKWEDRFYQELGKRVRQRRERLGLSQAAVAQQLGLTRASITNLEAGRQRPQAHQVAALAVMLQATASDLMPIAVGLENVDALESRDSEAIQQVLLAASRSRG